MRLGDSTCVAHGLPSIIFAESRKTADNPRSQLVRKYKSWRVSLIRISIEHLDPGYAARRVLLCHGILIAASLETKDISTPRASESRSS